MKNTILTSSALSVSILLSVSSYAADPDWWTSGELQKIIPSGIPSGTKIKDVSTATTLIPGDNPSEAGGNNVRVDFILYLNTDEKDGQSFGTYYNMDYFLNVQNTSDSEKIIQNSPDARTMPYPSIPNGMNLRKIVHPHIAVMDDTVVVSWAAQYLDSNEIDHVRLEYMYGRLIPSGDSYTIEWFDESPHIFKESGPISDADVLSNMYVSFTANITKSHNIVLTASMYGDIWAKSGTIYRDDESGQLTDNLDAIDPVRITLKPNIPNADPNTWGTRSNSIALLSDDSDNTSRGFIVEWMRDVNDTRNELYWHGVNFNFDEPNSITFANPILNASNREVNFDKGMWPSAVFVEEGKAYSVQGEAIIPLLEVHKSDISPKLYFNKGGISLDDRNSFDMADMGDDASMSSEMHSGIGLNRFADYEYNAFPSITATPDGHILLARACGSDQRSICTQWAQWTGELKPVEAPVISEDESQATGTDSVLLKWRPSSSYDIKQLIYRNGNQVAAVNDKTAEYVDKSLSSDTTYEYKIAAERISGIGGPAYSKTLTIKTDEGQPTDPDDNLEPPTNVALELMNSGNIRLTWDSSVSEDVVGYEIERDGVVIREVGRNSNQYVDNQARGSRHSYRVIAKNDKGESAASNTETIG